MNIQTLLIYAFLGELGILLQIIKKMQQLKNLANVSNLKFHPTEYFSDDYLTIISSELTLIVILFLLPNIEELYPTAKTYFRLGMVFTGFTGTAILDWLFDVFAKRIGASNRLLASVDYKTNIADKETGTLGTPTPAAPIKKDSSPKI